MSVTWTSWWRLLCALEEWGDTRPGYVGLVSEGGGGGGGGGGEGRGGGGVEAWTEGGEL